MAWRITYFVVSKSCEESIFFLPLVQIQELRKGLPTISTRTRPSLWLNSSTRRATSYARSFGPTVTPLSSFRPKIGCNGPEPAIVSFRCSVEKLDLRT